MILNFPDLQLKIDQAVQGRDNFPEEEWMVLPSRLTFLVPMTLPARVLRRLGDAQLRSLVFDRIPLPADDSKIWLLVPKLNMFSRGSATAWAVVAPLSALPAGFDRCLPEDLLLAGLIWDKRFSKGGWIVLDALGGATLIGVGPAAKNISVWKQLSMPGRPRSETAALGAPEALGRPRPPSDIPPAMLEYLGQKSSILRLNAKGSFGTALEKYGTVVTEDAAGTLAGRVQNLIGQKEATPIPNFLAPPSAARSGESSGKFSGRVGPARRPPPAVARAVRLALLSLSLLLPLITLAVARTRLESVSRTLVNTMVSGYENRFGTKIPPTLASNPMLALQDKSRFVSNAARQTAVSLQLWLSVLDRLSAQVSGSASPASAESALRLDLVFLDVVRIEIRGNAADQKTVAQWVSGLSSDPMLADVALVESKLRMIDRRTEFTVRARLRIQPQGVTG